MLRSASNSSQVSKAARPSFALGFYRGSVPLVPLVATRVPDLALLRRPNFISVNFEFEFQCHSPSCLGDPPSLQHVTTERHKNLLNKLVGARDDTTGALSG